MNLKLKQFIDVYVGKVLLGVNLVLVRGLGLLLRRDHTIKEPPKHIVVIKILGLGSVIMASDAIYSMRKRYPETKFTLLCGRGVAPGIQALSLFDDIKVIDDSSFIKLIQSTLSFMVWAWRAPKLWVVDLEVYSILTTILSAWTCARNRFGFQLDKTNFRNYLNTHNTYFNQFVRVGLNYQKLAESMGVQSFHAFYFPESYRQSDQTRNLIVINNTCSELGGDLRKLPGPLLAQICSYILTNTSYQILFVGAPADQQAIEQFIDAYALNRDRVSTNAGRCSFDDYYRTIGLQAKCMLSIDSAPLHIAQKLGISTLSFWGPISPVQRLTDTTHTYFLNKPCSPCIHHTETIPCGGNNVCMKEMEIERITTMLNALI